MLETISLLRVMEWKSNASLSRNLTIKGWKVAFLVLRLHLTRQEKEEVQFIKLAMILIIIVLIEDIRKVFS